MGPTNVNWFGSIEKAVEAYTARKCLAYGTGIPIHNVTKSIIISLYLKSTHLADSASWRKILKVKTMEWTN